MYRCASPAHLAVRSLMCMHIYHLDEGNLIVAGFRRFTTLNGVLENRAVDVPVSWPALKMHGVLVGQYVQREVYLHTQIALPC